MTSTVIGTDGFDISKQLSVRDLLRYLCKPFIQFERYINQSANMNWSGARLCTNS